MASNEDPSVTPPAGGDASDDAQRRERDEIYDRLLRVTAEFENYRRRTDRERRDLVETAAADLIRDLLPVVDDLERALGTAVEHGPCAGAVLQYRNGFDLIRRQLLEVLRRRGVEPLEVVGQRFDPAWHEAMADEPANGRPDGEITAEIRRGYRIGTKLIRPAMVKVAKA